MADEQVPGRLQIGRPKKGAATDMVEVERGTSRIADALSTQLVDDMAALPKMRQERERKTKKPDVDAGHAGHHRKYPDGTMSMSRQSSQHPFDHLNRPQLFRHNATAGCRLQSS
jgi:hypothetical protein